MTALRVAQVCADRGIAPGSAKGAAQHLRGVASGLTALGHRVTTYSRRPPEDRHPVPVLPLEHLAHLAPGEVDVVYERYSLGHTGGLERARSLGAMFVLEVNSPLVDEATSHRPGTVAPHDREVEESLLVDADLVVSVSSELTRWIARQRSARTLTQPNGFEPEWFGGPAAVVESPRYPLVFLGHTRPWHGVDRIVDLLVDLRHAGHRPATLMIGDIDAEAFGRRARRAGVHHQITFAGAVPAPTAAALLRQAGIGLAPYPRRDPFYFCPLKVIDYLAAGLPIVATRQGDIADLVGGAGLVVDPDTRGALAAAVIALLESPRLRQVMGDAGRARALSSMTWTDVAARTADSIAGQLFASTSR